MPLRNALRRPARLALTLGLLAMGGAMVLTAYQVERGWAANVAKLYETRSYDVEVLLHAGAPAELAGRLRSLPGVRAAEAWAYSPAAFARENGVDLVRTYPDRAHGSLLVMGPPPGTALVRFPVRAGRWLEDGDVDGDAVVLNHSAAAQLPGVGIGDPVRVSVDGSKIAGRVVGVVEEVGSPAGVYLPQARLARAMGAPGEARLFRISTEAQDSGERARIVAAVEAELAANGAAVQSVLPLAEHRTAIGDHVLVLIRTLVAMAAIFAFVGALGLASAMGTSVVERTREIGVMRTLGATPRRLVRMLLGEALALAGVSFVLACALSVPLTVAVGVVVGKLGFLAPLPLVLAPGAALAWLGILVPVAAAATLVPARRAAALRIVEAVGRV
jgi:putative ABC transport system permease protein